MPRSHQGCGRRRLAHLPQGLWRERHATTADAYDALRRRGATPSLFAGIPISIKDLFDVAGDVTTAGSIALRHAPPATRDATAVARLRAAGFIPIGRTNMTEFAFSGLGINPHYDTPRNPYDRKTGRIPGGSSSGAAVSVTDGMAMRGARHRHRRLLPHSGGAVRDRRLQADREPRCPTDGTMPLSQTLDSIGRMAPTVACCALIDAVLAGQAPAELPAFPLDGLRLAVPQTLVLDGLDADVGRAFAAALSALSARRRPYRRDPAARARRARAGQRARAASRPPRAMRCTGRSSR